MAEIPEWVQRMVQNQEQSLILMHQQLAQAREEAKEANKTIHELINKLSNPSLLQPTAQAHQTDGYSLLMRDLTTYSYDPEDECTVFKTWYERHRDEIDTLGAKLSDEEKRNIIVRKLDSRAFQTYSNSLLPKHPRDFSLAETIKNLETLFGSSKTLLRKRFEFLNLQCMPLTPTEVPFTDYMNQIKRTGEDAIVKDMNNDTLLSLMFILGLKDNSLSQIRENLVRKINSLKDTEEVPKIDELVNEANRMAASRVDSHSIGDKPYTVRYVQNREQERRSRTARRRSPTPHRNVRFDRSPSPRSDSNWRRSPSPQKSSSYRKYDPKPSQKWTKNRGRSEVDRKSVSVVRSEHHTDKNRTVCKVEIDGKQLKMQLDTGSEISIISKRNWQKLGQPRYQDTASQVKAVNGSPVRIYGKFETSFKILSEGNKWVRGTGTVFVSDDINLIGFDWCMQLPQFISLHSAFHAREIHHDLTKIRLKTVSDLQKELADVFEKSNGSTHRSKATATLQLKPNTTPVFRQPKPVPKSHREALDMEFDRLCRKRVISPIKHSKWAAPIVTNKQSNGEVQIFADFSTGLNDALRSNTHLLPRSEDITKQLKGGKLFSRIDFADAYQQINLEPRSREMATINTHRGLYRYNRLPNGIKSAPGILQQTLEKVTAGLNGTVCYLDEIIVKGRNSQEHRRILFALFNRIRDLGLRVCIDKCTFMMPELRILDLALNSDGRKMESESEQTINRMPEPKNRKELDSFLGLIKLKGTSVPEMRHYRGPLDEALRQDKPFTWSPECQRAFAKLKQMLTSDSLKMRYEESLPIVVAAKASESGIGAILMHRLPDGNSKTVCRASKSLTAAERRYGQIEKDGLALTFAVRKFHKYLCGRTFTLVTDNQRLLAYGRNKSIPATAANRLIRWALILRSYDFHFEIVDTSQLGEAKAISVLNAQSEHSEDIKIAQVKLEAEHECRSNASNVPVSLDTIALHTRKDPTLTQVIGYLKSGEWPSKPSPALSRYCSLKDTLSVYKRCLFHENRLVIPESLHRRIQRLESRSDKSLHVVCWKSHEDNHRNAASSKPTQHWWQNSSGKSS